MSKTYIVATVSDVIHHIQPFSSRQEAAKEVAGIIKNAWARFKATAPAAEDDLKQLRRFLESERTHFELELPDFGLLVYLIEREVK